MGMRAGRQDNKFLFDGLDLIGICFGYDWCAEHEWGIKKLQSSFGTNLDKFGIDRRIITITPDTLSFEEVKEKIRDRDSGKLKNINLKGIYFIPDNYRNNPISLRDYSYVDLYTAWCEDSFAAFSHLKDVQDKLALLYDAFVQKDIVMWQGGKANPFAGSGLCFAVASRLPESVKTSWLRYDR